MRHRMVHCGLVALLLSAGALMGAGSAQAEVCQDTPEGRVCSVQQPITAGTAVDEATQHRLGLVTVNRGCSGTLLNRYWVLTARHCVTTDGSINGPLAVAPTVPVTATWAANRIGIPSRIREFAFSGGGK